MVVARNVYELAIIDDEQNARLQRFCVKDLRQRLKQKTLEEFLR